MLKNEKNKFIFDYQRIFELSPEAIVILSKTGKFLQANNRIYDWLKYRPEEFLGKNILTVPFLPAESKKIIALKFLDRIKGKKVAPYVVKFITKNKKEKYGKIIGKHIKNSQGKIILDLVMISDVSKEYSLKLKLGKSKTEKKKLEIEVEKRTKEIYNSQIFLNSIINQSPIATLILDAQGTAIRFNKAYQKLFSLKSKEIIGKYNIFKDNLFRKNKLISRFRKVFQKAEVINFQIDYFFNLSRNKKKSNFKKKKIVIDITIFPVKNSKSQVTNAVIQYRDISEEVLKQGQLQASQKESDLYLNMAGTMIIVLDSQGKIKMVNKKASQILGYSKKEIIGKKWISNFLLKKYENEINELHQRLFSKTNSTDKYFENHVLTKNGKEKIISWFGEKIIDSNGKIIGYIGSGEDVSQKRIIEKQAKQREKLLEVVSLIAQELLKAEDWKNRIKKSLNILGSEIKVSRIYIFKNLESPKKNFLASQINEWVNKGVKSEINNPKLIRFSYKNMGFERWSKILSQKKIIQGNIKDFPFKEFNFLKKQKIKSILVMPIFIDDNWWGFIGFDECFQEHIWSKVEISVLTIVKRLIESSLKQEIFSENLKKQLFVSTKMNKLMIGRELRMIELKKQVKDLKKKLKLEDVK